jgi:hypothetical protein
MAVAIAPKKIAIVGVSTTWAATLEAQSLNNKKNTFRMAGSLAAA